MYQSEIVSAPARVLLLYGCGARRPEIESLSETITEAGRIEVELLDLPSEINPDKLAPSSLILIVGWRATCDEIEFLERLRDIEPQKPILVVAATEDPEDRSIAFIKGADNYLSPDFEREELTAKVRRLISRPEFGIQLPPISIRSLRIWPDQGIVMQGRDRVPLSRRELAMLLCLARNSPNPVSREDLEREAFGLKYDPGTNVVAVHIHRLRSKIQDGTDILRTLPGKGYQLC